jgi:phospholipid/cholesterol/gamma-HCH transport system substrate-binding protein
MMKSSMARPLKGLVSVVLVVAVFSLAISLFRGDLTRTVAVTVLSPRAGLVMYPDAKVKMYGVQIGKVESIEQRADGGAAIRLAMDPDKMSLVPANVGVNITSSTVFGAKFVQLTPPNHPAPQALSAGQVLQTKDVTVEFNTVFEQLTEVLDRVQPEKLNETLGAIATAFRGRGDKTGQMLSNLNTVMGKIEPSLPALSRDLTAAPQVLAIYNDSIGDLLDTVKNGVDISNTIVDQQKNLDAMLVSLIGLGQIGNDVLGQNRTALTGALHLLLPTAELLNKYNRALTCGIQGLAQIQQTPRLTDVPGLEFATNFLLGAERYRYPGDLPKVAAKGGPICGALPDVPDDYFPPYIVADVGANPFKYGNQGLLLNIDSWKQALFGHIDGPARNSAEIGHGAP